MISESDIREMPVEEKLRLFEAIWEDLSQHAEIVHSPDWHRSKLEATELRRARGEEEPIDWEEAKRRLRIREDGI